MDKQFLNDLKETIQSFNDSLRMYLPALETEVENMIKNNSTNTNQIENCLDTLLSLTNHGVGDEIFIKLVDYYKTVDEDGALFYWKEYDADEES